MKAIILAAGRGSRLYPITLNKPKGLLEVGDETILDRLVRQFKSSGIKDILIVVGYQKEHLMNHFGKSVRYRYYEDFSKTNINKANYKNVEYCYEAKQKKIEFGGALLKFDSLLCNEKYIVDENSRVEIK